MAYRAPKRIWRLYRPALDRRGDQSRLLRRSVVYRDYYGEQDRAQFRWVRWVLVAMLAILVFQSIFQLPVFRLRNITVQGARYVNADEVRVFITEELSRKRFFLFRNSNFFLFDEGMLARRLEERYFVEVTSIEKDFPDTLSIGIRERIAGFVIQTPRGYYSIDTRGAKIAEVAGPPPGMSVIADERADQSAAIPTVYLERVTMIKELWEAQIPEELRLAKLHMTDDASRIEVSTDAGYRVYFNPQNPLNEQIEKLARLLAGSEFQVPREYIDLRFGESLYVR